MSDAFVVVMKSRVENNFLVIHSLVSLQTLYRFCLDMSHVTSFSASPNLKRGLSSNGNVSWPFRDL